MARKREPEKKVRVLRYSVEISFSVVLASLRKLIYMIDWLIDGIPVVIFLYWTGLPSWTLDQLWTLWMLCGTEWRWANLCSVHLSISVVDPDLYCRIRWKVGPDSQHCFLWRFTVCSSQNVHIGNFFKASILYRYRLSTISAGSLVAMAVRPPNGGTRREAERCPVKPLKPLLSALSRVETDLC